MVVDLAAMTRRHVDLPQRGWVESIVGVAEENMAVVVYKNELVYLTV